MIYKNMEFHNVSAIETKENIPGIRLLRFPRDVRDKLGTEKNKMGRFVSSVSTGCEIRFVTSSKEILLTLSAHENDGTVIIFNGDIFHSTATLEKGKITTLKIERNERLYEVDNDMLEGNRFSSNVWRIMMGRAVGPSGNFTAIFHDIETFGHELRIPRDNEKPDKKWLAYGSSITHGSGATNHHLSYVQLAAYHLGVDVLNKGMGGTCLAEKEMIDFLVKETNWDFATFEIGVNMRSLLTPEGYEKRLRYLLSLLEKKKPDKPVFLITIYPNWNSSNCIKTPSVLTKAENAFNDVMRNLFHTYKRDNLYLIEGNELLQDTFALTQDLIHPSDYGHSQIAVNLTKRIKEAID